MNESGPKRSREIPAIAFCADRKVGLPLAVAFQSLLRYNRTTLKVYVITEDLAENDRANLQAAVRDDPFVSVEFLSPPEHLAALCTGLSGPRAAYFRLLLPDLLPERKNLLYLDVDILIRRDLFQLWEEIVGSPQAVQACVDHHPTVSSVAFGSTINIPIYGELGLPSAQPYYNSGVLGLNLEQWRERRLAETIINFLRNYEKRCPFWDQGGINAILGHEIEKLPPEWNAFYHQAGTHDHIVHFVSHKKPYHLPKGTWLERVQLAGWHLAQKDQPLYREYFHVVDETAYRGWRPRSVTLSAPPGGSFYSIAGNPNASASAGRFVIKLAARRRFGGPKLESDGICGWIFPEIFY